MSLPDSRFDGIHENDTTARDAELAGVDVAKQPMWISTNGSQPRLVEPQSVVTQETRIAEARANIQAVIKEMDTATSQPDAVVSPVEQ